MTFGPLRVLVIGEGVDYLTVRSLLTTSSLVLTVEHEPDYQAAIAAVQSQSHDAYFVDQRVGENSGLEFLQEVHEIMAVMPVIAFTSPGDLSYRSEALKAGASATLAKDTIDTEKLEQTLRSSVEHARIFDGLRTSIAEGTFSSTVIDENRTGVIVLAADGSAIVSGNVALENITGYALPEILGRSLRFLHGAATEDEVFAQIESAMAEQGCRTREIYSYRKDGSAFWNLFSVAPVFDKDKQLTNYIGLIFDLTGLRDNGESLGHGEKLFRSLIDNVLDVILVIEPEGAISFQSASVLQVLGFGPNELLGQAMLDYVHPEDHVETKAILARSLTSTAATAKAEFRFLHGDESWHILEWEAKSFMEDGVSKVVINARDITDRRLAEKQLRESRERYELAVAATNDGLWDWSLERGEVYFSGRWKQMLGLGEDELGNSEEDWFALIHPSEVDAVRHDLNRHIEGETPQFRSEHRVRHADGTYRYMVSRGLAVRDETGRAVRIVVAQSDITDQKITQEQLLHDALHDKLTGLPNRALFMDRLDHAIGSAGRRPGYEFAVLFLDLDRFKIVNDSLGHTIGDKLLIEVARRLKKIVRGNDTFARLGGDEFTILMEDIIDVHDATLLAERVQEELSVPFLLEGHEIYPTVSIGIALSRTGYQRAAEILRDADIAMYRAKSLGKARHEVFDRAMHQKVMTLLWMEADMRRALDRNEWELHYQPIVSLSDGKLAGFEALARWNHPERGMISPSEFIPIAEDTGLIVVLGEWVLHQACRQMSEWNARLTAMNAHPLLVAVNISSKQFSQPGLVEKVRRTLKEIDFDARSLKLEITESVIMENAFSAAEMLRQLEELNVQLSIDDFGTGYSSLSSLQQFPLHTLKIDRSFVEHLGVDSGSSAIIRTIVSLANNLGMDVIAEGIETEEQLGQLLSLGCDYGQGYYFSKPLLAHEVEALLKEGQARWELPAMLVLETNAERDLTGLSR